MRTTPVLLALCSTAAAQQQIPILEQAKAWLSKATAVVSSAASSASSAAPAVPNPVSAGASAIAASQVETLTINNWKSVLTHRAATASPGPEEWMVYVTGGNKTCYGRCEHAEGQWNRSVPLLVASKKAPNLAMLDCETETILCNTWNVGPPSLMHVLLPQPAADQSTAGTEARFITLNRTSVTADEIAAYHTQEKYKEVIPYEGYLHPFTGTFAETGANFWVGYFVYYFSLIPSWAFMIGVSMLSRGMMSRARPAPPARPGQAGTQGAPAGARPAART